MKSNCDINSNCDTELAERRLGGKRLKKGFSYPRRSDAITKKSIKSSLPKSKYSVAEVSDSINLCLYNT